tara:strand:+ start:60 stop:656 length:597 start_codon:yes stop_codon:yes gene_type:complete
MIIIPRRAHRKYIYGPDILQELLTFVYSTNQYNSFDSLKFSCRDVIRGACIFEPIEDFKSNADYKAILNFKSASTQGAVGVIEKAIDSIPSINYDEDLVVQESIINADGTWSMSNFDRSVSFIHVAVALNKKMLTNLVEMPDGYKWSFAKLVAKNYDVQLLKAKDTLTLSFQGEFNKTLFKSSIKDLGDIYFYLDKIK